MLLWLVVAGIGFSVLAASTAGASHPVIHPVEVRVFEAVNGLPDWLLWPLWAPMQLGNLAVGTGAGLVVAAVERDVGLAAAVLAATALKLVSERVIRHRMADWLKIRQRPGTSQPHPIVRGADVPTSGPSFPSGHVILAFGVACVVATAFAPGLAMVAFLLAALVGVGRVFVGAHNPLDITAGAGAGLLVGGVLAALLLRS